MNLKKGTEITIDERSEKWRRVYQILPSENHTRNSFLSVISIFISFFFLLSIREIQLGLHPQPTPTPQKNEKKNEKDNAVINQPLFFRVGKKKNHSSLFFSKKFSLLASSLIPFGSRASQKKKIHLSQSLGLRRYFHHSYEVRNEGRGLKRRKKSIK